MADLRRVLGSHDQLTDNYSISQITNTLLSKECIVIGPQYSFALAKGNSH